LPLAAPRTAGRSWSHHGPPPGELHRLSPDGGRGTKRMTYELPGAGPLRAQHRRQPPPGAHHQVRIAARPPAARRGGLALPPTTPTRHHPRAPPGRPGPGSDRDRLEGPAAPAPRLAPARQQTKRRTIVAVAVARQLAGFCWAFAAHNSELLSVPTSTGIPAGGRPPHADNPQPPKQGKRHQTAA
jgi:hypothetical protein